MSDLINISKARDIFGATHILREAMAHVPHIETGKRAERLYDRAALAAEISRLSAVGWRRAGRPKKYRTARVDDDGRWRPDHPGPWTPADMVEFNRRCPFRRECVAGFVDARRELRQRVVCCKGVK